MPMHCCKKSIFRTKNDILKTFVRNSDCRYTIEPPRRGGSYEYPQSIFKSKNKKNMYTPVTEVCFIKVGCVGIHITQTC